jgi:hypothetical protein
MKEELILLLNILIRKEPLDTTGWNKALKDILQLKQFRNYCKTHKKI